MAGEVSPETARSALRTARDHMLDTVDALGEVRGEADSHDLAETEAKGATSAGVGTGTRSDSDGAGNRSRGAADRSGEPRVRAVVNGAGTLVGLTLSAESVRINPGELSREIVAVATLAARKAAVAHAEVMRRAGWAGR